MVVDERSRHELYRRLEEVLGPEAAATLIEHLPPVGWADVATKGDLAVLEERMDLRFARVDDRLDHMEQRFDARFDHFEQKYDERFDHIEQKFGARFDHIEHQFDERIKGSVSELRASFEHELRGQTTTMVFGLVSVVLTMAALAFALVRFT